MRKLILIGNGFDLAHGLKTSYKDFSEKYYDHPMLCKFRELVCSEFVENNVCFFHILHEMRCLYSERLDEPVKN